MELANKKINEKKLEEFKKFLDELVGQCRSIIQHNRIEDPSLNVVQSELFFKILNLGINGILEKYVKFLNEQVRAKVLLDNKKYF